MFKLGAILGHKDPRNLQLGHYLQLEVIPEPPPIVDWIGGHEKSLQMWANDKHGDCVFAAFYNMLSVASGITGDPFSANDNQVLADYAAVTGFDPSQVQPDGSNPTDQGTNPEDALKFYSKLPDGDQRKIIAYGEVDHNNFLEIRQACYIFGGIYTALALPLTAQSQVGKIWDVSPWHTPDRIPGSWGGHMVLCQMITDAFKGLFDFDLGGKMVATNVVGTVDTWGTTQKFTTNFWKKYCTASYFFITEKWIADNTGKTPGGLDLNALLADVKELKEA